MKHFASTSLMVIALFASSQAFAQDCTPQHEITTVNAGFLTVAAPTFPPFSVPQGDGGLTGIDGEIVNEIAARECLEVRVEQVEYATAVPYVISNRADVAIGNYYRTAERGKVVNLSAPLYLDQMGIYSKDGISSISDLVGRRVGTVQGYLWVSELQGILGSELTLYNNYVALYQDLDAGRIDVAIDGIAVGTAAQQEGALQGVEIKVAEPDERVRASVAPPQAGLPLTPGNEGLLTAVDEIIADLHATGRLAEIMVQFGMPESATDVGEPRLVE